MQSENIKLFDSELKVMDILWKEGIVPAKYVADRLTQELGWNKNTTYTLIKRCINKGAIERTEPGFMCHALIAKEQVQDLETDGFDDLIHHAGRNFTGRITGCNVRFFGLCEDCLRQSEE